MALYLQQMRNNTEKIFAEIDISLGS